MAKFKVGQEVFALVDTDPDGELMYQGEVEVLKVKQVRGDTFYVCMSTVSKDIDLYPEYRLFKKESTAIRYAERYNGY